MSQQEPPSYHDLYIRCAEIPERTSIFNLPYGYHVGCHRAAGWRLWSDYALDGRFINRNPRLVAGEFDGPDLWLTLDVDGHTIVDSYREVRGDV